MPDDSGTQVPVTDTNTTDAAGADPEAAADQPPPPEKERETAPPPVAVREPKVRHGSPLAAWFLGPKAEHGDLWFELLSYIFQDYIHWRRNYFPHDPVVISRVRRRDHEAWSDELSTALDFILNALKAHYPFYSPRYLAHMLSEQTLPSVLGYFAGLLYNPNNVTDEAAPVTVRLELEVGRMVAEMLGFKPRKSWAHLCSGGTVANVEALWVARSVQMLAFTLRDYCRQFSPEFTIKPANISRPDSSPIKLTEADDTLLLGLRPNEAIFMLRKLARFEVDTIGVDRSKVLARLNEALRSSPYNVRLRGISAVAEKLKVRPIILVSAAAHYSIKKTANILGYGEDAVRFVPVTSKFRMDVGALRDELTRLKSHEYVAAVIGIVGTTEEGAVDPIHEIATVRDESALTSNRSFWLHIDAAWGGYVRSLFCGHEPPEPAPTTIDEWCGYYASAIDARETVASGMSHSATAISWDNADIYKAFIAMREADSITVDPHKLGYVPYPAGLVAFRNGLVTELLTQRAQYISDAKETFSAIDDPPEVDAVGPYILEGSKPGFVATGCWLAHKTIPLTVHGHGKIMKTTLLNSKKLYRYLTQHRRSFVDYEKSCGFANLKDRYTHDVCRKPFTFAPLNDPDTNVICFIAIPMKWKGGRLDTVDVSLRTLNLINEELHRRFDIPSLERGVSGPHGREYFISKTKFERQQYSAGSVADILARHELSEADYNIEGLSVLRSTVMNPLYFTAAREGMDYLRGFVAHLHRVARPLFQELA